MKIFTSAIALLIAAPSFADVAIQFDEGAPKDRFSVTNVGDCDLGAMQLTIDISKAPSGLIFDVTGDGAGVEVFQPFELVSGQASVTSVPEVADGQQSVALQLAGLPMGKSVAFTIDVDDTTSDRQITVSGSEIAGAEVRIMDDTGRYAAAFGVDARAMIALTRCVS